MAAVDPRAGDHTSSIAQFPIAGLEDGDWQNLWRIAANRTAGRRSGDAYGADHSPGHMPG